MVKGRPFTLDTKKAVRSYAGSGLSLRAIQKKLAEAGLQIARSTIGNYIGRPISDGPGHKKKFSGFRDPRLIESTKEGTRLKRRVLRTLNSPKQHTSALEVMAAVGINDIKRDTWRRYLHSLSEVDFQLPRSVCNLGPGHKQKRVQEAKRLLGLIESGDLDLKRTAFIDEKSFRLDGPAGKRKVYFIKSKGRPQVIKRIAGGGQVMLILCMTADGFTYEFLKPRETITAVTYAEFLVWALREGMTQEEIDAVWDDQARPHTAAHTLEVVAVNDLRRVNRAAKFQDVQMAEKAFAVLTNRVYRGNRQFASLADLQETVTKTLEEMNSKGEATYLFNRLRQALPGRMRRIVAGKGELLESQWGPEDDPRDVIELDDSDDEDEG